MLTCVQLLHVVCANSSPSGCSCGLLVIFNQVVRFQRPDATPAKMTKKALPVSHTLHVLKDSVFAAFINIHDFTLMHCIAVSLEPYLCASMHTSRTRTNWSMVSSVALTCTQEAVLATGKMSFGKMTRHWILGAFTVHPSCR